MRKNLLTSEKKKEAVSKLKEVLFMCEKAAKGDVITVGIAVKAENIINEIMSWLDKRKYKINIDNPGLNLRERAGNKLLTATMLIQYVMEKKKCPQSLALRAQKDIEEILLWLNKENKANGR